MSVEAPISSNPLSLDFQIDEENYSRLIDGLLAETEKLFPASTKELTDTRRQYFIAAISKGTDLSKVSQDVASLSHAELVDVVKKIPDRGFDAIDRKSFADAGRNRPSAMLWNNLFPQNRDEIILPFSKQAKSLDDKINAFIEAHNVKAGENFTKAQKKDQEALILDPTAKPRAGKAIKEQEIRLKVNSRGKVTLETHVPGTSENVWRPGPKFGKFLQDQYEWELFDIFQLEMDKSRENNHHSNQTNQLLELKDIANRAEQKADALYDSDNLRVVISRDPQKIGEMSTGQRWESCMAKGGLNYDYVPRDIEAGSLVAYVIHKDDVEARYPLMRQLIKPFRSQTGQALLIENPNAPEDELLRETILVPSFIYGGYGTGNSRTRDGLNQTLHNFVQIQNAGKTGKFHMDSSLYADGQAVVARLSDDWSPDDIRQAVHNYQDGALLEYAFELEYNKGLINRGNLTTSVNSPENNIKKFEHKIHRILDSANIETGLARMFHQAMIRTSPGTIPSPKAIIEVIADDDFLIARKAMFEALEIKDQATWEINASKLPINSRLLTAVVSNILKKSTTAEPNGKSQITQKSTEQHEEFIGDIIKWEIDSLTTIEEKFKAAAYILEHHHFIENPKLFKAIGGIVLDNISILTKAEDRVKRMEEITSVAKATPTLEKRAFKLILDEIDNLPNSDLQMQVIKSTIGCTNNFTTIQERAINIFLDKISQLQYPANRISELQDSLFSIPYAPQQVERVFTLMLNDIQKLPYSNKERANAAINVCHYASKASPESISKILEFAFDSISNLPDIDERLQKISYVHSALSSYPDSERWFGVILDKTQTLFTAKERIKIAGSFDYIADSYPALHERTVGMILQNIPELPTAEERIQETRHVIFQAQKHPNLQEQAMSMALNYISDLPTAEERINTIKSIFYNLSVNSPSMAITERIFKTILDNIPNLSTPQEQVNQTQSIIAGLTEYPDLQEKAITMGLHYISDLPTAKERIQKARYLFYSLKDLQPTAIIESIFKIILDNIPELPNAAERAEQAQFVSSRAAKNSMTAMRADAQITIDNTNLTIENTSGNGKKTWLDRAKVKIPGHSSGQSL